MALDSLRILIDVVDSFSDELSRLLEDLNEVEAVAESVDNITIDVDVRGQRELNSLIGQMAALGAMRGMGGGDVRSNVLSNVNVESEEINSLLAKISHVQEVADEIDTDVDVDDAELEALLGEVQTIQEIVDPVDVDVDVDDGELDALLSKIGAAEAASVSAGGGGGGTVVPSVEGGISADMYRGGAVGAVSSFEDSVKEGEDAMNDFNRGMSESADHFDILNPNMQAFHNLLADVLPIMKTYSSALPAAIGGLISLGAAAASAAAAIGALVGLGALGFTLVENTSMQGIVNRIKKDFMEAFKPIAKQLAPLFRDALQGLQTFFNEVASRADVLLSLRDDVRAFGGFLLDWVPDVLAAMGKMADAFAPLFGKIASALQGMNVLKGLTNFMADAAPALFAFASAIIDILPLIAKISIGFMDATAAMTQLLKMVFEFITVGGRFTEQIGVIIGSLLVLYSITTLATGAFSMLDSIALSLAGTSLMALVDSLFSYITAAIGATEVSIALANAIRALMAATVVGAAVAAVMWVVSNAFGAMSTNIDEATKSLRNFDSVRSSMGDVGVDSGGTSVYKFNPTTRRTVINADNVEDGKRTASYNRHVAKHETNNGLTSGY